jgi:hypothetical protein
LRRHPVATVEPEAHESELEWIEQYLLAELFEPFVIDTPGNDPSPAARWKPAIKAARFLGKDADAGERSAIIYSIIESCRRHGIEPYTYLHDVLTRWLSRYLRSNRWTSCEMSLIS